MIKKNHSEVFFDKRAMINSGMTGDDQVVPSSMTSTEG